MKELAGRNRYILPVSLVLLAALALRAYRLGWQSLWSDEGASVVMTTRSLPQILAASGGDIHPPLYYILLSGWSHLSGTSEFSLRFLSLAFGVLLVALLYKLGERLFLREAGLLAAILGAISPFLVYYSQEARMYMLGALLGALAALLFLKALERDRYWPAYALAAASALYTQYFTLGVILALSVSFLWFARWYRRRPWRGWLAAHMAVLVLYLPWLSALSRQAVAWPGKGEPLALPTLLEESLLAFNAGPLASALPTWGAAPALALLVIGLAYGLWAPVRNSGGHAGLSLACLYLLAPLATIYLVSLSRPAYDPKFLLFAAPAFYLLLGLGAAAFLHPALGRPRRPFRSKVLAAAGSALLIFMVALPWATVLGAYYFDPQYSRDNYRALARHIQASARPGDAAVLNAPGQQEIFSYYYRGSMPVYPLPLQRPMDEAATSQDLQQIASRYSRLWVVLWAVRESDPTGFIERWLDQRAYKAAGQWFGKVRLALYQLPPGGERRLPLEANLGGQARLSGFALASRPSSEGTLAQVTAGDILPLTLFWQRIAPMTEPYKVFVHVLGAEEDLWGQHDSEPIGGSRPTTAWQEGETVADNHGLPVYPGTPPGLYQIEVGMYHQGSGQRLPLLGPQGEVQGDRVVLGDIRVDKPPSSPALESLAIQHPLDVRFGDLRLLGYEFFKLGTAAGNVDFRQGDLAHLALFWRAERKPDREYEVTVSWWDERGQALGQTRGVGGHYPTRNWDEGELVRDQHRLLLDTPPGRYRLALSVASDGTELPASGSGLRLAGRRLLLEELQVR